jgi:hypothetical protein
MNELINLAKKFILQPAEAWERVKGNSSTARQHLKNYILPLAVSGAIATFIGYSFVGYGTQKPSFSYGFSESITKFIAIISTIIISGFLIHKMADLFKAEVSLNKSIKLIGFSFTPILISAILNFVPALGLIIFLAIPYSLYILYSGFNVMIFIDENKSPVFFLFCIALILIVYLVLALITGALFLTFGISDSGIY